MRRPAGTRPGPALLIVAVAFAAVGCSSSTSGTGAGAGDGGELANDDAGGRAIVTCAQLQTLATGGGLTWQALSWGEVPASFQSLPPGATLCGREYQAGADGGSVGFDYVTILTPLEGSGLLQFYAPLASAAGCAQEQSGGVGPANTYAFSCANDYVFSVVANGADAYISLGYSQ
jgi:hypothetical protein